MQCRKELLTGTPAAARTLSDSFAPPRGSMTGGAVGGSSVLGSDAAAADSTGWERGELRRHGVVEEHALRLKERWRAVSSFIVLFFLSLPRSMDPFLGLARTALEARESAASFTLSRAARSVSKHDASGRHSCEAET